MRAALVWAALLPAPFTVQAACSSLAVSGVAFGTYTGAVLATTATVTVTCDNGGAYQLALGTGNGASTSARRMANGGAYLLSYGLFQDAAHGVNWGNVAGTDTVNNMGSGAPQVPLIYAQVLAAQNVAPGTYSDSVNLSVVGGSAATLTVTATIVPACTMSASDLSFGTYSGAQLDASSTLTITCTNTTPYYVNLDSGGHSGGNDQPYASGPGGALLAYTPYRDETRSTRWGNTAYSDGVAGTGSGGAQTLTIYGRVAGGSYVRPGLYTDIIIAKVTY